MPERIVWSKLHDLTYLFLSLAHGADQDLAKQEAEVILQKVAKWDPMLLQKGAKELVQGVAKVYKQDRKKKDRTRLAQAIKRLKLSLTAEELSDALTDLLDLAKADGVILDSEWFFLDDVKEAWGVLGQ